MLSAGPAGKDGEKGKRGTKGDKGDDGPPVSFSSYILNFKKYTKIYVKFKHL